MHVSVKHWFRVSLVNILRVFIWDLYENLQHRFGAGVQFHYQLMFKVSFIID